MRKDEQNNTLFMLVLVGTLQIFYVSWTAIIIIICFSVNFHFATIYFVKFFQRKKR